MLRRVCAGPSRRRKALAACGRRLRGRSDDRSCWRRNLPGRRVLEATPSPSPDRPWVGVVRCPEPGEVTRARSRRRESARASESTRPERVRTAPAVPPPGARAPTLRGCASCPPGQRADPGRAAVARDGLTRRSAYAKWPRAAGTGPRGRRNGRTLSAKARRRPARDLADRGPVVPAVEQRQQSLRRRRHGRSISMRSVRR